MIWFIKNSNQSESEIRDAKLAVVAKNRFRIVFTFEVVVAIVSHVQDKLLQTITTKNPKLYQVERKVN